MSDFADIFAQIIQKLGGRDAVQSLLGVGPSALSIISGVLSCRATRWPSSDSPKRKGLVI